VTTRKKCPKGFKFDAISLVNDQGYSKSKAARSISWFSMPLRRFVKGSGNSGEYEAKNGFLSVKAVAVSFFDGLKQECVQWSN